MSGAGQVAFTLPIKFDVPEGVAPERIKIDAPRPAEIAIVVTREYATSTQFHTLEITSVDGKRKMSVSITTPYIDYLGDCKPTMSSINWGAYGSTHSSNARDYGALLVAAASLAQNWDRVFSDVCDTLANELREQYRIAALERRRKYEEEAAKQKAELDAKKPPAKKPRKARK